MGKQWSVNDARSFWQSRFAIFINPPVTIASHLNSNPSQFNTLSEYPNKTVQHLLFWIKYLSWGKCDKCHRIFTQPLLPNFCRNFKSAKNPKCVCETERYIIPQPRNVPIELSSLTKSDIYILRPFDVDTGTFKFMRHGYRARTALFSLKCSNLSVKEKIEGLTDPNAKKRCQKAYEFLLKSDFSSYKDYIDKRQYLVDTGAHISNLEIFSWVAIECALWPHLYWSTSMCDSIHEGLLDRASGKLSFLAKCFGPILDYSMDFQLLQYIFDRWMFKTITGAVNQANFAGCTPYTALSSKTFSPSFWQRQHRYLLDVVRQKGFPNLFITISPSEWTFTSPFWLDQQRDYYSLKPLKTPLFETSHFIHVLEQIVRGYLCGTNDQRWSNHLFSYNNLKNKTNVDTFFYRFEFQERGTVHLHLLLWLHDFQHIQFKGIRADIPQDDDPLQQYVTKFQKSNSRSKSLSIQPQDTYVTTEDKKQYLHIKHTPEAFAENLRAYIDTLLPSLKCSMDVQTSDGHGMILRYVTSYVSKWSETFHNTSLFNNDINASHAAFRYLINLQVCEPEMWTLMLNSKIAYSFGTNVDFHPPHPDVAADNKVLVSYYSRPNSLHEMSLIQWLRHVNSGKKTSRGKSIPVFVGVTYLSFFNPLYFFQLLMLNHPHSCVDEILPTNRNVPSQVLYFVKAQTLIPKLLEPKIFENMLQSEGHKIFFINNVLSYLQSLKDIIAAHSLHFLPSKFHSVLPISNDSASNLNGLQLVVYNLFMQYVIARREYYNKSHPDNTEWMNYIVITGHPGTGKTYTLQSCIDLCIARNYAVAVVTPTGALSCLYKAIYGDKIKTETIHSMFKISIDPLQKNSINWQLSFFDVLFIDEISQISRESFDHMVKTINLIPIKPVIMMSGDFSQQQPLSTVQGKVKQVSSIKDYQIFVQRATKFNLHEQFRIRDNILLHFLQAIRHYKPTETILRHIQKDRILCDCPVTDEQIIAAHKKFKTHLFLTVSNAATNIINDAIISQYTDKPIISTVMCTKKQNETKIFNGMPVMLLENRDKSIGFVNGQLAAIHSILGSTVIIKHPNGNYINVYPLTCPSTHITYYPFTPAYSCTIAKVQGQTLPNIILWADIRNTPPGTLYVALSRVRNIDNVLFLTELNTNQFQPV